MTGPDNDFGKELASAVNQLAKATMHIARTRRVRPSPRSREVALGLKELIDDTLELIQGRPTQQEVDEMCSRYSIMLSGVLEVLEGPIQ